LTRNGWRGGIEALNFGGNAVASFKHEIQDRIAATLGRIFSKVFRALAWRRLEMPRFNRMADAQGFQIRSTHYYEPTYREEDLPENTAVDRPLPGIAWNDAGQLALLAQFDFGDELRAFPQAKPSRAEFGFQDTQYGRGDAEIYYSMIRTKRPRRIFEIGSGDSTLIANLAVAANRRDDPKYDCAQICIEPYEMDWLEGTGVTVIRERVEKIDLAFFDALGANDILFIDSSHIIRPWGDVLREFHEIIPRVAPGVIIHVHDIFSPRDYPENWLRAERRLWNEQYLLEAFLAFNNRFEIICANNWLWRNHYDALAKACPMTITPDAGPSAFWFQAK
jgi:predicted O-methyltransferase YrrM